MTAKYTRLLFTLLLAGSAAAAGCASGGERIGGGSGTTLSQEDMASVPGENLYEIVDRLRPRWLQVRNPMSLGGGTPQIVVFMNNAYLGGPDELRQFRARDILEVRYMDGPQASAQLRGYPSHVPLAGAIVLITSDRDRD